MTRGPSEISKEHKISLTNSWSYGITLDEDNIDILNMPIHATTITDDKKYWGYWDISQDIANNKAKVITYSMPFLDNSGQVVGVIGIEISQDFLYKNLPFGEFSETGSYGYTIITVDNTDEYNITPLITQGTVQQSIFSTDQAVPLVDIGVTSNDFNFTPSKLSSTIGDIGVYYEKINLYAPNTPFEDHTYYLLGLTDIDNIILFAQRLQTTLFITLLISLVLGAIISYAIGFRFSRPIVKLSNEVSKHSLKQEVKFEKMNIAEIDELSSAIEELNNKILNSAYKMDKILDMLNIGVGSFEYIKGKDFVTISSSMQKIIDIESEGEYILTVPKQLFFDKLNKMKSNAQDDISDVYRAMPGVDVWYKIMQVEQGDTTLGVVSDVTKEVLEKRALNYEHNFDMLTGIYNRLAFRRKSKAVFNKGNLKVAAFIMFDLDNLKYVNDTFGHDTGDIYIKTAATLLSTTFTQNAFVGRMSGDEFYVFLYQFDSREQILQYTNKLYERLENEPIILSDSTSFKIRMSGGISWYGTDTTDFEQLITYADFAMYNGKHTLKGELRNFNKEVYQAQSFMLSGKEELNRVLDNGFVEFVFQPIVSAKTGEIYGYEALMRPVSDVLNTPVKLLQIAAAQSQLWKIEKITFFKTLSLYVKYKNLFKNAKLFINSVPNQCLKETEYKEFESLFKPYLNNIIVEIIETEQLDEQSFRYKLDLIASWGSKIALDDYGSGYNNDIGVLNINPHVVKIDRTLLTNIHVDPTRQAILNKILGFCKQQKIFALAEGVETQQEMKYLIDAGVDYLQGYYISRPISKPDFNNNKIAKEVMLLNNGYIKQITID